jgi:hypothetical protein
LLLAKRTRHHTSLFASLLAVVAIASALGVGVIDLLDRAADAGVRAELATRVGADLALRLTLDRADEPGAQDEAVRAVLTEEFGTEQRPIDLEIDRTVVGARPLEFSVAPTTAAELTTGEVVGVSIPELSEHAELVAGRWAMTNDEATIQADAAEILGLTPGDRILLPGAAVELVGTWRVSDSLDPRWLADALPLEGLAEGQVGPINLSEDRWADIEGNSLAVWTLVPDAARLTAQDLATIQTVWSGLDDAVEAAKIDDIPFIQEGSLAFVAQQISTRLSALEAAKPIALLIVAAIALVTMIELGRLLAEVRSRELDLLWARGATPLGLAGWTFIEALPAALVGGAIGAAGARSAVQALAGAESTAPGGDALWFVPLTVALAAGIALAGQTFVATRRVARHDQRAHSGRALRFAGTGAVVLVALTAALSIWQLQLYGSPLTPVASGGMALDPVTVVAPALALVAVALLGLLLFPRLAPLGALLAARRLGARRVLAARSLARRLPLAATPIVLLALATGQLVIAGGYGASWEQSFTQTQQLRAGAETRLIAQPRGLSDGVVDAVAATPGLTELAAYDQAEASVAGEPASLVGVMPDAFARLALDGAGTLDTGSMSDAIRVQLPTPVAGTGGSQLEVNLLVSGFALLPSAAIWATSDGGVMRRIPLTPGAGAAAPATRFTAELPRSPELGGSWRVAAVDLTPQLDEPGPVPGDPARVIELDAILIDGTPAELGDEWSAYAFGSTNGRLAEAGGGGFAVPPGAAIFRLVPPLSPERGDDVTIPVAMTSQLAERIGIVSGARLPLGLVSSPVRARVTEVVAVIPGARMAEALLVDLAVLDGLRFRSLPLPEVRTSYWIGSDAPAELVTRLRAALPGSANIETLAADPDRRMLGSAAVALWVAAAGTALLAIAALGAVVGAQLRARRDEVVILRAIGVTARDQGRIRRQEFSVLSWYGMVVGITAGFAAVAFTVAPLARASVPDAYRGLPTLVVFDPVQLAIALLVLAGLVAAVVAVYVAQVRGQAAVGGGPEEGR